MAFINGSEILFSPLVNVTHGANSSNLHCSQFVLGDGAWQSESQSNALYHFKVCKYVLGAHVNADLSFRIGVAQGNGEAIHFRYPVNMSYPYDTGRMRIMFVKPRIIFEDEANKNSITYFRLYEKQIADSSSERELWMEIKTASGYQVTEAFLNMVVGGGEFANIALAQEEYEPYVSQSGYDSLTVISSDWANKTSVPNIDSRAVTEGASADGIGNRAEGRGSDVGGINNTTKGEASFVRGWGTQENGKCNVVGGCEHTINSRAALVGGEKNTNTGNHTVQGGISNVNNGVDSVQGGNGNHNDGYSTVQVGQALKNYAGNAAQFGHTNENHSMHTLQTGYKNTIPEGCDYASTIGTQLKASRRLQAVRGIYNKEDDRAIAVWGNGTSDTARKNAATIAASGAPEIDTDLVTLKHFNDKFTGKFTAGTGNTNTGTDAIVVGNGNTNNSANSAVFGLKNTNKAALSLLSGTGNTNNGSNTVMVGHTNTNDGQHTFIHGYENHNDLIDGSRFDYVDMHGTRLKASRRGQMLRGQWNKVDNRAAAIWGNGTEEKDRRNALTVAASGTPEIDTDAVTLGYLLNTFKEKIKNEIVFEIGITIDVGGDYTSHFDKPLENGGRYVLGDAYFTAALVSHTGIPYYAPPANLVVYASDGTRGEVCHDGSNWGVLWDKEPSSGATLTLRANSK